MAELEHSAIHEASRVDIQTSELCIQHISEASLSLHENPTYGIAARYLQQALIEEYADSAKFVEQVNSLLTLRTMDSWPTPRRLELELMSIAKVR